MSSILRALKKLENEPRHLDDTRTLDSKLVPLADTRPPKKTTGFLWLFIGGGAVCGLVVLAGLWLFSGKSGGPADAPITRPDAGPAKMSAAAPEKSPPLGHPAVSGKSADSTPIVAALPAPEASGPEAQSVKLPRPAPQTIEQSETLSGFDHSAAPGSQQSAAAVADKAEPVDMRAAEAARIPQKTQIPVLNDPDMMLQAITWSANPQKRLAIVNNRILRQGETVGRYRIKTINQDDIVLHDGDQQWKLLFRIR